MEHILEKWKKRTSATHNVFIMFYVHFSTPFPGAAAVLILGPSTKAWGHCKLCRVWSLVQAALICINASSCSCLQSLAATLRFQPCRRHEGLLHPAWSRQNLRSFNNEDFQLHRKIWAATAAWVSSIVSRWNGVHSSIHLHCKTPASLSLKFLDLFLVLLLKGKGGIIDPVGSDSLHSPRHPKHKIHKWCNAQYISIYIYRCDMMWSLPGLPVSRQAPLTAAPGRQKFWSASSVQRCCNVAASQRPLLAPPTRGT